MDSLNDLSKSRWMDEMKLTLAKITLIRTGHKATGKNGLKMVVKWDLIKSDLMKVECFKDMKFKEGTSSLTL